jgi:hypothetical protein
MNSPEKAKCLWSGAFTSLTVNLLLSMDWKEIQKTKETNVSNKNKN